MRLAVMRKNIFYLSRQFYTVFQASLFHHFYTAERLDGTPEQLVSLQSDDKLVITVDIPGFMRRDCGYNLSINGTNTIVAAFFLEGLQTDIPDTPGALCRTLQKRSVACVRYNVFTYEVCHVNLTRPHSVGENGV